jgi:hypothetical protein
LGKLVKAGAIANSKIELYEVPRQPPYATLFSLWIDVDRYQSILIADEDPELLERYVTTQHDLIRWSATRATP